MADREARVKAGEDLVVTQHGREVARLMPIGADACADLRHAPVMAQPAVSSRTNGVQVIARAAQILRALDGEPNGLSLSQLSERLSLSRSTVHRVVSALSAEGLLAIFRGLGVPAP